MHYFIYLLYFSYTIHWNIINLRSYYMGDWLKPVTERNIEENRGIQVQVLKVLIGCKTKNNQYDLGFYEVQFWGCTA